MQGEEAFLIEVRDSGEVLFHIRAFSRPRHPLVRLGGPVARRLQRQTTRRYLDALHAFVATSP